MNGKSILAAAGIGAAATWIAVATVNYVEKIGNGDRPMVWPHPRAPVTGAIVGVLSLVGAKTFL